jgi:hypothetical protein
MPDDVILYFTDPKYSSISTPRSYKDYKSEGQIFEYAGISERFLSKAPTP